MLENLDKIMHLRFNFDACPMHSPSGFVHLTHQNLSARELFCLNSLAKVNTQLLIYNYFMQESFTLHQIKVQWPSNSELHRHLLHTPGKMSIIISSKILELYCFLSIISQIIITGIFSAFLFAMQLHVNID